MLTRCALVTTLLALSSVLWSSKATRDSLAEEPSKLRPVLIQDFEKASALPKVWVVNIPTENASVQLTTDHPHEGKQCLKLHYHFVGKGDFQYLGIPNKTRIQAQSIGSASCFIKLPLQVHNSIQNIS